MIYLISVTSLSILLFILFFILLNIVTVAKRAIVTSNSAMVAIRSPDLDDEEKEDLVQAASITLLISFFSILIRSVICLGVSAIPIVAFDYLQYVPMQDSYDFMSRMDVIIIASVIVTLLYLITLLFKFTRARLCPSK